MKKVWITRTANNASKAAEAITAKGYEAVIASVLEVHPLDFNADALRFDAVIVTSLNGLNAFCRGCDRRDVSIWCVGDATADAARAQGFAKVISASGDVAALFDLIKAKAAKSTQFLYAAAKDPAAPLMAWLWAEGFRVTQVAVYETRVITPDIDTATLSGLSHILIHSPRAGGAVADILIAHPEAIAIEDIIFVCISEAAWRGVKTPLAEAYPSLKKNLKGRISAFPDEASMLMLID